MVSKEIGIEEARKVLGDLATEAQQGTDIILTRNRRPVARITRCQEEETMHKIVELEIDATPGAVQAVAAEELHRHVSVSTGGRLGVTVAGVESELRELADALNQRGYRTILEP